MGKLTFILGGARSGKSSYAENLALQSGHQVTFVATAQPLDEEMAARIANHRRNRPADWQTREIPQGVGKALLAEPPAPGVVLIDCLTLLISNVLMQIPAPESPAGEQAAASEVNGETSQLLEAIQALPGEWIVVSNEVGLGLVPPYPLGRLYRDLLGWANQRLAANAERVIFMIAGLPMQLARL
jgi:adenosylcobinamide kinase/adenosylcobinamide-phosphate guanylyltransferase